MSGSYEVPLDRVVKVIARFPDGRQQWGSGFLVSRDHVLTAWHCLVDVAALTPADSWQVQRASDGQTAEVVGKPVVVRGKGEGGDWGLDLAVLELQDPPWQEPTSRRPRFARVDRSQSGELAGCVAVGYPLYQYQPGQPVPTQTAELRGTIRQADAAQASADGKPPRRLQFKDPDLGHVAAPPDATQARPESPFGGLSGALVFHQGWALGHVVAHHTLAGKISLVPIERLHAATGVNARRIVEDFLHLPSVLPIDDAPVADLAGLVELLPDGELPRLEALTPYDVGADPTLYGGPETHGDADPYVPRISHEVDARLRAELAQPGALVLLVGPSKAGKTRTAFEAVRAAWPDAVLAQPAPGRLAELVRHPRVARYRLPLVLWLDDIHRFLVGGDAMTPALLTELWTREGPTVVVGTLRVEEREWLIESREMNPSAGQVLDRATQIDLAPTCADLAETQAARQAYPALQLEDGDGKFGLAEQLAGAPILWERYEGARHARPVFRAVVETAVDWARVGLARPIPEQDLRRLALARLADTHKALDVTYEQLGAAEAAGRTPPRDAAGKPTGRVSFLQTPHRTTQGRAYYAYPYLVAGDDGQRRQPRDIPAWFWDAALTTADVVETYEISMAAAVRGQWDTALRALNMTAELGADDDSPAIREKVAQAHNNRGSILGALGGRHEDALAAFQQAASTYGGDDTPAIRRSVAKALFNQGVTLIRLGRDEDALAAFEAVDARYWNDPNLRDVVASALFNQGTHLKQLGRQKEALAVFERVVSSYGLDETPAVRAQVAQALVNEGSAFAQLKQPRKALAAFEEVRARYGQDPDPDLRLAVARALSNSGVIVGKLNQHQEAISFLDEVDARFRDDPSPAMRAQVASALVMKGYALTRLCRPQEAIAAYDEVATRYSQDPEAPVRWQVRRATSQSHEISGSAKPTSLPAPGSCGAV
jgi:tetratricopeptide (TPR) repeat protein